MTKHSKRAKKLNALVSSYVKDLQGKATPAELRFKEILEKYDIKYYYQHPFQRGTQIYVLDFVLPDYATIVEIDGAYHLCIKQQRADAIRTARILQRDRYCRLIRLQNKEVLGDEDALMQKLSRLLCPWLKD